MESIIKSLSFDWRYCLAQMVLFILLCTVLNQIYWKPMLSHLARRDKRIQDAYDAVDGIRTEMETLRADYQARIIKIEGEARSHIQQAIKEAQMERERILTEARTQSEAAIQQGIQAMEREKAEAITSLHERMVAIALGAVDKAVGRTVDPNKLRRSVENSVAARN